MPSRAGALSDSTQRPPRAGERDPAAGSAELVSARDLQDASLTNALIDAHGDDSEFGYRFLADVLDRAGLAVGERRVWRLCSQQRLWSTTVRKRLTRQGRTPRPGRPRRSPAP